MISREKEPNGTFTKKFFLWDSNLNLLQTFTTDDKFDEIYSLCQVEIREMRKKVKDMDQTEKNNDIKKFWHNKLVALEKTCDYSNVIFMRESSKSLYG